MGDPTMAPFAPMHHVIDYAHSEARSDWMDIFCFSQCMFILGTTSGAVEVAKAFGVPAACTNFAPMGQGAASGRDIWIPKLYWSTSKNRYLTFTEVLLSPYRSFGRTEQFEEADISVVDNSPGEIRDLVAEMMDRLEGRADYSASDEDLQRQFKGLLESDPMYATAARVGRHFLRSYSWLLPGEALGMKRRCQEI
jgi:putative glycosyltransferase (TIGR04372 family)